MLLRLYEASVLIHFNGLDYTALLQAIFPKSRCIRSHTNVSEGKIHAGMTTLYSKEHMVLHRRPATVRLTGQSPQTETQLTFVFGNWIPPLWTRHCRKLNDYRLKR